MREDDDDDDDDTSSTFLHSINHSNFHFLCGDDDDFVDEIDESFERLQVKNDNENEN